MPSYATVAQLQIYVDTTGLSNAQMSQLLRDAERYITIQLDGSSLNSTGFAYIATLHGAVTVANKNPVRVRMGQGETDATGQIDNWKNIVEETLHYAKMDSKRG